MSLRPIERVVVRRDRYKVSIDAEEGRQRREDNMVEIRKNRREESLKKKRREGQAQPFPQPIHSSAVEKKVISLHTLGFWLWLLVSGARNIVCDHCPLIGGFRVKGRSLRAQITRNAPILSPRFWNRQNNPIGTSSRWYREVDREIGFFGVGGNSYP